MKGSSKNSNAIYIGETKRTLGTRIKEHKADAGKALASRPYTRNNRQTSKKETHKSAIINHMTQQNHTVDWEWANFVDIESDWNRDEGRYRLSHIYDDLLKGHPGRGRGGHTPE